MDQFILNLEQRERLVKDLVEMSDSADLQHAVNRRLTVVCQRRSLAQDEL